MNKTKTLLATIFLLGVVVSAMGMGGSRLRSEGFYKPEEESEYNEDRDTAPVQDVLESGTDDDTGEGEACPKSCTMSGDYVCECPQ